MRERYSRRLRLWDSCNSAKGSARDSQDCTHRNSATQRRFLYLLTTFNDIQKQSLTYNFWKYSKMWVLDRF